MIIKLSSHLLNNLGYVIAVSFFFTKFESAKNIFIREKRTKKDTALIALFFSGLAILGTYVGVDYKGSIVNTRNIGVIVGGVVAGPEVGIIAGIIASIHRYLIDPTGITTVPCSISTIIGGLLSAYFYKKSNNKNLFLYGFLGGFIIETLSMILILLMAHDFQLAKEIVSNIYIPMILANSIGVAAVILIIEEIITEKEITAGKQAKLALEIANKTLPYFRKESLNEVCKIIADSLEAKAAVITDTQMILASYAKSNDFIIDHTEIKSEATKEVLKNGKILALGMESELNFHCINGNIQSCIISPIFSGENVVFGTLKIYFDKKLAITSKYELLAEGLSMVISTQLEISNLENFKLKVRDAELKALQAQINPHFLFNVLHTTSALVRIDPVKARKVISDLGTYLRFNLENSDRMVSLAQELEQVKAYVDIEETRFSDKISVTYDIEETTENINIPSLTLQPLVENSIKHGILPKSNGGQIHISAQREKDGCMIVIEDNGVGMSPKVIEDLDREIDKNIGLKNVHNRLKIMYGNGLRILSSTMGTRISFFIKAGEPNAEMYNS